MILFYHYGFLLLLFTRSSTTSLNVPVLFSYIWSIHKRKSSWKKERKGSQWLSREMREAGFYRYIYYYALYAPPPSLLLDCKLAIEKGGQHTRRPYNYYFDAMYSNGKKETLVKIVKNGNTYTHKKK